MAHDVTGVRLHGSVVLNHYVGGINPAAVRGALGRPRTANPISRWCGCPRSTPPPISPRPPPKGSATTYRPSGAAAPSPAWPSARGRAAHQRAHGRPAGAAGRNPAHRRRPRPGAGHRTRGAGRGVPRNGTGRRTRRPEDYRHPPCYDPPAIGAAELAELAGAGAYIELSFILVDMGLVSFEDTAAILRRVGAEQTILSTDVGPGGPGGSGGRTGEARRRAARGGDRARGHRHRDEA